MQLGSEMNPQDALAVLFFIPAASSSLRCHSSMGEQMQITLFLNYIIPPCWKAELLMTALNRTHTFGDTSGY